MPPILLDTNILVYVFDIREPERQSLALGLVERMEREGVGRLSVQSLGEFFNVATRKLSLSPAAMYIQVERWREVFPVFNLTPQIVLEAARGVRDHKLAYYDAQIWAAARLNQIPVLFSEDFQDGLILEGVRFANPFLPTFDLESWL
jgi:predicted nucleic acid-binding protein